MPFGASALLVPDVGALRAVHHASVYLNRPEDEAEGQLNLVGRSLDTSRRFDALKVLIALRATGRKRLGEMVDAVLDLTQYAADAITQRPELELVAPAGTIMVAFRHAGGDEVNIRIHRDLFASGAAVIGRTRVNGAVALKLTLHEPGHDARGRRRPARPRGQRRSVTGSLTVRFRPAAFATVPVIQTVFKAVRGLVGSRRRRDTTRPATILRRTDGAAQRALGPQPRRSGAAPPCSPGRTRA